MRWMRKVFVCPSYDIHDFLIIGNFPFDFHVNACELTIEFQLLFNRNSSIIHVLNAKIFAQFTKYLKKNGSI